MNDNDDGKSDNSNNNDNDNHPMTRRLDDDDDTALMIRQRPIEILSSSSPSSMDATECCPSNDDSKQYPEPQHPMGEVPTVLVDQHQQQHPLDEDQTVLVEQQQHRRHFSDVTIPTTTNSTCIIENEESRNNNYDNLTRSRSVTFNVANTQVHFIEHDNHESSVHNNNKRERMQKSHSIASIPNDNSSPRLDVGNISTNRNCKPARIIRGRSLEHVDITTGCTAKRRISVMECEPSSRKMKHQPNNNHNTRSGGWQGARNRMLLSKSIKVVADKNKEDSVAVVHHSNDNVTRSGGWQRLRNRMPITKTNDAEKIYGIIQQGMDANSVVNNTDNVATSVVNNDDTERQVVSEAAVIIKSPDDTNEILNPNQNLSRLDADVEIIADNSTKNDIRNMSDVLVESNANENNDDMNNSDDDDNMNISDNKTRQYRIRSRQDDNDGYNNPVLRFIIRVVDMHQTFVSNYLSDYLRWAFAVSFTRVAISIFIKFILIAIAFTIMIYIIAQSRPYCIYVGGTDFVNAGSDFVDAFQLSWTTLSTVGYGAIGPETPASGHRCLGINMLMAIEAFVGVLFGSVTGAIIFGKVARIQSIAHVRFSYPICVRYGSGVLAPKNYDVSIGDSTRNNVSTSNNFAYETDGSTDDYDEEEKVQYPCPILEFRLINEMSRELAGEIINAKVNVVASTLKVNDEDAAASQSSRSSGSHSGHGILHSTAGKVVDATKMVGNVTVQAATYTSSAIVGVTTTTAKAATCTGTALLSVGYRATAGVRGNIIQKWQKSILSSTPRHSDMINDAIRNDPLAVIADDVTEDDSNIEAEDDTELTQQGSEMENQRKYSNKLRVDKLRKSKEFASITVDEGNSNLAPPKVYHKLEVETDSHPFFKRSWNIRHVLDASSPLLSAKARREIEENDGCWPDEWNNSLSVRELLQFNEIIVSFTGKANASGTSVYAQQVYEYEQVAIGYTFASVVYTAYGQMVVDEELLNDVKEQNGGGAEPWDSISSSKNNNVLDDIASAVKVASTAVQENGLKVVEACIEASNQGMSVIPGVEKNTLFSENNGNRNAAETTK